MSDFYPGLPGDHREKQLWGPGMICTFVCIWMSFSVEEPEQLIELPICEHAKLINQSSRLALTLTGV